jgi:RsiW-degrading membrane proteinase PrsW (M82 family)
MAEETGSGSGEKKQIGGELVIPVAALIFTLYYFSTIYNSPWTAQVSAFFIGAILLLLIAIFLVKCRRGWP